ncbi:MAG: hypothetical protein RSA02_04540 [Bacteroidales bacterium]
MKKNNKLNKRLIEKGFTGFVAPQSYITGAGVNSVIVVDDPYKVKDSVTPFEPHITPPSTTPKSPITVVPSQKPGIEGLLKPGDYNQSTAVLEDVYIPNNPYGSSDVLRRKRIVLIIVCALVVVFVFLKK